MRLILGRKTAVLLACIETALFHINRELGMLNNNNENKTDQKMQDSKENLK